MDSDSDDESYIIEAERKSKQNYLTEEILDSNYDPELFMMFCSTKKGADIDQYTFEELQECVHDFKMTYRRGQSLAEVLEAEEKKKLKKSSSAPKSKSKSPDPPPQESLKTVESTHLVSESKKPEIKSESVKKPVVERNLEAENKRAVEKSEPEKSESKAVVPPEGSNETLLRAGTVAPKSKENLLKKSNTITPKVEKPQEAEKKAANDESEAKATMEEVKNVFEVVVIDQKFSIPCVKAEQNPLSLAEKLEFIVSDPELVEGGFFASNYHLYPVKVFPIEWEIKRRFSEFVWLREMLYLTLPGIYIPPIPAHKSRSNTEEELLYKRKKILLNFMESMSRHKLLLMTPVAEGFFKLRDYKEFLVFQKAFKKKAKKPEAVEQMITAEGVANCDISYQGPRADKLMEYTYAGEVIEKKLKRQAEAVMNDIKSMQLSLASLSELVHQLEEVQNTLPYTHGLKSLYSSLSSTFSNLSSQEIQRYKIFKDYYNIYFKYSYLEKLTLKELLKERESLFNEYTKAELKQKNLEKFRNFYGFSNIRSLQEAEGVIEQGSGLMNKNFVKFAEEKVRVTTELHSIWTQLIESISQSQNIPAN